MTTTRMAAIALSACAMAVIALGLVTPADAAVATPAADTPTCSYQITPDNHGLLAACTSGPGNQYAAVVDCTDGSQVLGQWADYGPSTASAANCPGAATISDYGVATNG